MVHPRRSFARCGALALTLCLLAAAPAAAVNPTLALGPDGQPSGVFLTENGLTNIPRADTPCTGDFDGDGHQDVVSPFTASPVGKSGAAIAYGDGTGHLGPAVRLTTIQSQAHCTSADLDDDGLTDVVVGGTVEPAVQVFRGSSNRQLPGLSVLTAAPSRALATGDADGDGRVDVFDAQDAGATTQIAVLLGDGAGNLNQSSAGPRTLPGSDVYELETADLNNDDRTDAVALIAVPDQATDPSVVSVLAQPGSGNLGAPVGHVITATTIALIDANMDGTPDLVSADVANATVSLGSGSGAFADTSELYGPFHGNPAPTRARAMTAADLTGDGAAEVLAGDILTAVDDHSYLWAFGATGTSTAPYLTTSYLGPWNLYEADARDVRPAATGDFDEDGRPDVVASLSPSGLLVVLLNTTPVPAVRATASTAPTSTGATATANVSANGFITEYGAELVSPSGSATRRPVEGTLSAGSANAPVSIPLDGLAPDADQRFRVYATNALGTTVGPTRTLRTTVAGPIASEPPQISGTARPGQTLSCSAGVFTGSGIARQYGWRRGGVPLSGETATDYLVRDADVGQLVSCRVTATNAGGSDSETSPGVIVTANAVVPEPVAGTNTITPGPVVTQLVPAPLAVPAGTAPPRLSGRPGVGSTLACEAGDWIAGGRFAYAWLRDGVLVPGATSAGYAVTRADAGRMLACRVTVTNAAGSGSATSGAMRIAAAPCLVPKLTGATLVQARARLTAAGCRAGRVTRRAAARSRRGKVLRSTPAAGVSRPAGARVGLIVGR
jgi:hypothetical protein